MPPIIAYHIIFGAYGFWLPNDPRGSWSQYVFASRLQRFGPPRPLQHAITPEDELQRQCMKQELRYPPVRFSGLQAHAVGRGFGDILRKLAIPVYAAAVMPDHMHLVVGRREMHAESIVGHLKRAASRTLNKEQLRPLAQFADAKGRVPTCWEDGGWKVFLHSADEIELAMMYVNANPLEAGLREQRWSFLQRFEG